MIPGFAKILPVIPPVTYSPVGPKPSSTASDLGFINLQESDIIMSSADGFSIQNLITTGTSISTSLVAISAAHVLSSSSAYAFNVMSVLLSRGIINGYPLTGGNSGYLSYFRNINDNDIVADQRFKMGNISIISIKKIRFGESIKPLSFTATTSAGTTFIDSISADETLGILKNESGLTAGLIFYDLGYIIIHGPTVDAIKSISALTSVSFHSTYKIFSNNIFCTAKENELNYTKNETAFYISSITGDPINTPALLNYDTYGYKWGIHSSLSSDKGNVYLSNLYKRQPYITSIGLYNKNNELLVIAKLAQPIKRPSEIPFTVRVCLDFQ